MQDLTVTVIQSDLAWENREKNVSRFEARLAALGQDCDLIVLPEMFTSGFTMNAAANAEPHNGPTVAWMREMAARTKADLTGSLIIKDGGRFYNRLYWVKPDGNTAWYDKRHLFRMADEHSVYNAGRQNITVELKGWKVRPFICYDLRFPVWSRNRRNEYDAAVYVANWPQRRTEHWRALLLARAIENQCYVIGVNRVGRDGLGVEYSGDSMIADPLGNELVRLRNGEAVHTQRLSRHTLDNFRQKFPAWMDGDGFEIG